MNERENPDQKANTGGHPDSPQPQLSPKTQRTLENYRKVMGDEVFNAVRPIEFSQHSLVRELAQAVSGTAINWVASQTN